MCQENMRTELGCRNVEVGYWKWKVELIDFRFWIADFGLKMKGKSRAQWAESVENRAQGRSQRSEDPSPLCRASPWQARLRSVELPASLWRATPRQVAAANRRQKLTNWKHANKILNFRYVCSLTNFQGNQIVADVGAIATLENRILLLIDNNSLNDGFYSICTF